MAANSLNFICITGHAYSGKDTSADYIVAQYNKCGRKYAIKVALADLLKAICRGLIKMFYNVDIPLSDFYNQEAKDRVRYDMPYFCGKPFSLRTVLQQVGTEIFRNYLWSSIWCDYVEKVFIAQSNYRVIVISDIRRHDELDYFAKFPHMTSLRINRDCTQSVVNLQHASEASIGELRVKYDVQNYGTIPELYSKLEAIIQNDTDIEHPPVVSV